MVLPEKLLTPKVIWTANLLATKVLEQELVAGLVTLWCCFSSKHRRPSLQLLDTSSEFQQRVGEVLPY
jgi:hypothetical protein